MKDTKYVAMTCNAVISLPSASIRSAAVDKSSYNPGEVVKVSVSIKNTGSVDLSGLKINVDIADPNGNNVIASTLQSGISISAGQTYSTGYISHYTIPSNPVSGTYKVAVGLWNSDGSKNYDIEYQITSFEVIHPTNRYSIADLWKMNKNPSDDNQKIITQGIVVYSTKNMADYGGGAKIVIDIAGAVGDLLDLLKTGVISVADLLFGNATDWSKDRLVDMAFSNTKYILIVGNTAQDSDFYNKYKIKPYLVAYGVNEELWPDVGSTVEIEGVLKKEVRPSMGDTSNKPHLYFRIDRVSRIEPSNYVTTWGIAKGEISPGKEIITSGIVKEGSNSREHELNIGFIQGPNSMGRVFVSYPTYLTPPTVNSLVVIHGTLKNPEIGEMTDGYKFRKYVIDANKIEILQGKVSDDATITSTSLPVSSPILTPTQTQLPTSKPTSPPTRTPEPTITTPSMYQAPRIENLKILAPPSIKKDESDKIQVSYKLNEGFNPFKSESSLLMAGIFKMTIKNKVIIKEKWGLFDLLTRDVSSPVEFTRTIERSGDDVIVRNDDGTSKTVTFNELDNYLRSYDYQIPVKGSDFKSGFLIFEFWEGVHNNVYAEVNTEYSLTSSTYLNIPKTGSFSAKSEYVAIEVTK